MDGDINIGNIVEVVDKKDLNGIRYKVEQIIPGMKNNVYVGPVVRCMGSNTKPVGYTLRLWGKRLKVVDSTRAKTVANRKIFSEKGWGP